MAATVSRKGYLLGRLFKHGVTVGDLGFLNQTRQQHSLLASKLLYTEYGDPLKVVQQLEEKMIYEIKPNELLVKMLASPVNPADINTIQGKYPVRPTLPSVPGNEGVGEIVAIGNKVQHFAAGDRVVPLTNALGTWRSHIIISCSDVHKVPMQLGLVEAATLTVNPCTAFRMLRDFVSLKPGDTVIQNGANSACGQNVIQIARVWGLRTVNIVRDRPNIEQLKSFLQKLGATYTLTEEELRTTNLFRSGKVKKPRLALNCVGGKSSLELMRHLADESTIVTYGGMSREPVTVPTGSLIFKDIRVRGFWMTQWTKTHFSNPDRRDMLDEIVSMMTNGEMHGPAYTLVPFKQYKEALINTMTIKGMIGKKYILDFQQY